MKDRSIETRFSSARQPENHRKAKEKCHKGHPMTEGDSNVRIRVDGRRVCRACESSRRRDAYQREQRIKAGVQMPFRLDNLYYDLEVYEHTSVDVLSKFYGWQKSLLDKAKENPEGVFSEPDGTKAKASTIITSLESEMPILYQHIMQRMNIQ